jgi:hypothetical protein
VMARVTSPTEPFCTTCATVSATTVRGSTVTARARSGRNRRGTTPGRPETATRLFGPAATRAGPRARRARPPPRLLGLAGGHWSNALSPTSATSAQRQREQLDSARSPRSPPARAGSDGPTLRARTVTHVNQYAR